MLEIKINKTPHGYEMEILLDGVLQELPLPYWMMNTLYAVYRHFKEGAA